jgi:hypothetical protein
MSFQTAINEMDNANERAVQRESRRRLRILQIRRLERVLEAVEMHNLHRDRQVPPAMWRELQELDTLLPVPAPPALWQARNTARLHDAILDWEAELLDVTTPQRSQYDDLNDDD